MDSEKRGRLSSGAVDVAAPPPAVARGGGSALRRFGPLVGLVPVLLIALLVLPSSLSLPQANPSTTPELAPIPPSSHAELNPSSNFSSLSLAGSSTLGSGAAGNGAGGLPPLPNLGTPTGSGGQPPELYQCVGGRQTADPLAPPCSAYQYQGSNGGSTYAGVTGGLIKILIYYDGNPTLNTPRGEDVPNPNTIVNMDAPPQQGEVGTTIVNRGWEHYFDLHYQTYNRHVQFWVQYGSISSAGTADASTREADAAFGYQTVHPFAVIDYGSLGGFQDIYNNYMVQHGVLLFGSAFGRTEAFYSKYPGLQWGYDPTTEEDAQTYTRMVCAKLNNQPVDSSAGFNGQSRKFGFMEDGDPSATNYAAEDSLVLQDLKSDCGLTPAVSVSFPHDGYAVDTQTIPSYAVDNMLKFKQDGVTTILWPVGYEVKQSQEADSLNYFPEWILGDDPTQFSSFGGDFQDTKAWSHAWIVSSVTYTPEAHQEICYQSYRSVDESAADSDVSQTACAEYNDLRQLFDGIQVAGPKLTPHSIDEGFHAIPAVASTNPQVPACFYNQGDYTCVKDSVLEWFNPNGTDPNNPQPGCWQMIDDGTRFLNGFPSGNLAAQQNPADVCNGFDTTVGIDDNPPSP